MKTNKMNLYLGISWLGSLLAAYGFGWWTGVKNTTQVVSGAADSGFWLVGLIVAVVAVFAAIAAFRTRGFLDDRQKPKI